MDLKLAQLSLFKAVAETGSILSAADRIGRTPSAVSMALKQLSEDVGAPLFVSDRKNELTDVGRYLLDLSEGQLLEHRRAMASLEAFVAGEIGRLDLAAVPSVATRLLPNVIRDYVDQWPGVQIDVRDMDSASVSAAVTSGMVEIGIAGRPRDGATDFELLFEDRLLVVGFAKQNNLEFRQSVPLEKLRGPRLIANGILESLDGDVPAMLVDSAGLMVRNTSSLLAMVRAGVGYTILPRLAVPLEDLDMLTVAEIGPPSIDRKVGIVSLKGKRLSRAADAFRSCLVDFCTKQFAKEP